jgi:hypothetical protein
LTCGTTYHLIITVDDPGNDIPKGPDTNHCRQTRQDALLPPPPTSIISLKLKPSQNIPKEQWRQIIN